MKVVILCGGMGFRLREETELKPKPMVEIGGKPILWHVMKIYATQGFSDFILCLGYKGSAIKQYFLNYAALNSPVTLDLAHPGRMKFHASHGEKDWKVTLADTGFHAMDGLDAVTIRNTGTAVDGTDISAVKLWADNYGGADDNGSFAAALDTSLDSGLVGLH